MKFNSLVLVLNRYSYFFCLYFYLKSYVFFIKSSNLFLNIVRIPLSIISCIAFLAIIIILYPMGYLVVFSKRYHKEIKELFLFFYELLDKTIDAIKHYKEYVEIPSPITLTEIINIEKNVMQ